MTLHFIAPRSALHMSHKFFFFNDTATTEIYTLSLHDALPIWRGADRRAARHDPVRQGLRASHVVGVEPGRSEEHTSELQSRPHLVCRLLLEKKKRQEQYERIRKIWKPSRHHLPVVTPATQ